MNEFLQKIEAALEEVELQLFAEFNRLGKAESDTPEAEFDSGVKTALTEISAHLWQELEQSGDRSNLSLRSKRQEHASDRVTTIKKLLDARIAAAYLRQIKLDPQKKPAEQLADLARRLKLFDDPTPTDDPAEGRAIFRSRELSAKAPGTPAKKNATPQVAASRPPPIANRSRAEKVPSKDNKEDKKDLAQTPEAIRKKLQDRQDSATSSGSSKGRASFGSKDINPVVPQEAPRTQKVAKAPPPPPTGKAVFKSKDLSSPPGKK